VTAQVHIVEDDPAVRESLTLMLVRRGHSVSAYPDGTAFLAAIGPATKGCAILDLNLPDMDGITLLAVARSAAPELGFVVLTGNADVTRAVEAMKRGASDFVEKPATRDRLLAAIAEAQAPRSTADPAAQARIDRLTEREREVMALLAAGHSNKEVARSLGISPRTAEVHRRHVMEKTGVDSLAAMVRMAISAGLHLPPRT